MACKIHDSKHSEFRLRLAYQMNGFDSLVSIYQNYPDAWLCARIMEHVGKMITENIQSAMKQTDISDVEEVCSTDVKYDELEGSQPDVNIPEKKFYILYFLCEFSGVMKNFMLRRILQRVSTRSVQHYGMPLIFSEVSKANITME